MGDRAAELLATLRAREATGERTGSRPLLDVGVGDDLGFTTTVDVDDRGIDDGERHAGGITATLTNAAFVADRQCDDTVPGLQASGFEFELLRHLDRRPASTRCWRRRSA